MSNDKQPRRRASNTRTALVLASVAAVFFFGAFAVRYLGTDGGGLSVLGLAILVFLAIAIGRNLRSRE